MAGVSLWLSGLGIQHYHSCGSGCCCGVGSTPSQGIFTCCRYGQKKKKKSHVRPSYFLSLKGPRKFCKLGLLCSKAFVTNPIRGSPSFPCTRGRCHIELKGLILTAEGTERETLPPWLQQKHHRGGGL